MSDYGFDETDETFTPPKLPKRTSNTSKQNVQTAVKAGQEIGFIPRDTASVGTHEPKDRRQLNKEPQGKILITGPERILAQLRTISIETNQPYWKVVETLLERYTETEPNSEQR